MPPSIRRPRSLALLAFAVSLTVAACGGSAAATTVPATPGPSSPASAASATPAPTMPEISGGPALYLTLDTADASTVRVAVIDQTGLLTGVASGTPGDGASVAVDAPTVVAADTAGLVVTWAAPPCDSEPTVILSETGVRIVQPPCLDPTDAVAFDRVLILHTSDTIDPASLEAVIQDAL